MSGVGGGGLFSDGKISLPPSGSWMWGNMDSDKLRESYYLLAKVLHDCDIPLPDFDQKWITQEDDNTKEYEKSYKSIVMSDYSQTCLLEYLYRSNKDNIITNCNVDRIQKTFSGYTVYTNDSRSFYCKQIVFAFGKFGYNNIELNNSFDNCNVKKRIEVGIRIECNTNDFMHHGSDNIDYKL